ncbi:lysine--tRNA ligase [Candidatus Kaiserbacteria bacterium RIFCSPHIGHO2_01_FULL_56_24]|uniref:Lysine--tRNA ligase n=1 Tax=Candidatus Kaiserbacteria bacterium RIFCSPHIGHO2_01_FULL_56_24 TaxID=1798487 RepID=A0A1F6DG20_9BACT|nr:MAG: lysine--tRNA ligase [Candidatus Kaiserbacteria bacterium RIFCSPHIGHO2_01_FULL_56_24]
MASGDDIRADRLKKLELLKLAGMGPYPAHTDKDADITEFLADFDARLDAGTKSTLAGRVMSKRGQGGIVFIDLFDGTEKAQIVFQKEEIDEALFQLFSDTVDVGDFIEVTGVAYKTQRGHNSLKASVWKMLAKSLLPIPDQWFGLKDEEAILRQRYLDILLDEEVRAMFARRTRFWQAAREFLLARSFMEVETPILETTPGGADARPFSTHHNALDIDLHLRISLELWLKRLLVAGYPKVFEIGRIFRNEGQSREHLQDYTQLETYEAYSDMRKGMQFTQDLYRHIVNEVYGKYTFSISDHTVDFAEEWPLIDFGEALEKAYGVNPITCSEKEAIQAARDAKVELGDSPNKARAIDNLWKQLRKKIAGPAFLIGVPVYLEPLAKRSEANSDVVERFQVILAGSEMGKGFSELNDPQDQRARFEDQQKMRDAGDDEAQRLDEDYVKAMEYGMPPAFGFGVSERLFSFLENRPAHEAQLFPLLRPKND